MNNGVTILRGDVREIALGLAAESFDGCLCDPPYGLSFMGKKWDYDVPSVETWAAVLGALKPGAHLLAFAGTRTQHRMAVRIEDAGFEIRDMIAWVYGSGFPKSLDVSKAIDKAAGAERGRTERAAFGGTFSDDGGTTYGTVLDGRAITPDAARWQGYGTALKPALEPITVARKPLRGTVAANVLAFGTGAINVDGCRVGTSKDVPASISKKAPANCYGKYAESGETAGEGGHDPNLGRWPANLIHDGSDEVLAGFPETNGSAAGSFQREKTSRGLKGGGFGQERAEMRGRTELQKPGYPGAGSAARFFYCAKAGKKERGEGNNHPTVKPLALAEYLARLILPPKRDTPRRLLVPFSGSGSEIIGALRAGWDEVVGIELSPEYAEIAEARIAHWAAGQQELAL